MPGFDISTWFGIIAPAGTPPDVIAKWNTEVVEDPELAGHARAADGAGRGARADTPEQFAAFIASELPKYARIVKASGAKVD